MCARTLPSHVFQSERALDAMLGACGSLDPRSEYKVRAAAGRLQGGRRAATGRPQAAAAGRARRAAASALAAVAGRPQGGRRRRAAAAVWRPQGGNRAAAGRRRRPAAGGHRPRVSDENSLQPRGETEEARRVLEKLSNRFFHNFIKFCDKPTICW